MGVVDGVHVRRQGRHPQNADRSDPNTGYCFKNGGAPPWGFESYKVQVGTDKRGLPILKALWRPDETVVAGKPVHEWTRECLQMAARGVPLAKLRDFCNGHCIPAPRRRYSSTTTWYYLLQPHVLLQYAGFAVWGMHGKKRPPSEWEVVERAHPPLISLEEAQAIKQARHSRPRMLPQESGARARSEGSRFLLSGGLFRCARCGANVTGFTSQNGKGRRGDYYVCGSAQYRRPLGWGGDAVGPGTVSAIHRQRCLSHRGPVYRDPRVAHSPRAPLQLSEAHRPVLAARTRSGCRLAILLIGSDGGARRESDASDGDREGQ